MRASDSRRSPVPSGSWRSTIPTSTSARPDLGAVAFPALFVLLWSTGFIAAKYGLPYAPPFAFLAWRMVFVSALLGGVALAMRAPWPGTFREYRDLAIVAILVHAMYLGGVFVA